MTRLAQVKDGQIVARYDEGRGWVTWANGDKTSPPVAGITSPDGLEKLVPIVEEVVDNSTGEHKFSTVDTVIEENRVLQTTTLTDAPAPDVTEIHKVWLEIYLEQQGWLAELETIIAGAEPDPTKINIAAKLWDKGTYFGVNDPLVVELWSYHSQAINNGVTVQDVFNAAAALSNIINGK